MVREAQASGVLVAQINSGEKPILVASALVLPPGSTHCMDALVYVAFGTRDFAIEQVPLVHTSDALSR